MRNHSSALIPLDSIKNLEEDWDILSSKNGTHQFRQAIAEASKFIGKPPPKTTTQSSKTTKSLNLDNSKILPSPSNPVITIDPFTGEQTIKKKRGRPPKNKSDDKNSTEKDSVEEESNNKNASKPSRRLSDKELAIYCKKLQKILLRPELKVHYAIGTSSIKRLGN